MSRLAAAAPAHALALDWTIEVAAWLLPPAGAAATGLRVMPSALAVTDPGARLDPAALFAGPDRPTAGGPRAGDVLVAHPAGRFRSTDQVVLTRWHLQDGTLTLALTVRQARSDDGEPAPRELFVLIDAGTSMATLAGVTVAFDIVALDEHDHESSQPSPPDCVGQFERHAGDEHGPSIQREH